jgi:hypothetical protein
MISPGLLVSLRVVERRAALSKNTSSTKVYAGKRL